MADNIYTFIKFHETRFDIDNATFTFLCANRLDPNLVYIPHTLENATHSHIFYEIFIVKAGSLSLELTDGKTDLSAGDAIIMPPPCLHHISGTSDELVAYCLSFAVQKRYFDSDTDLYSEFTTLFGPPYKIIRSCPELVTAAQRLIRYSEGNHIEKWQLTSACFNEAIFICKEMLERDIIKDSGSAGYDNRDFRNYIIDEYINTYFTEDISLETLSSTFYLTAQHINRIIKKNYGVPFRQRLIQLRVQYAMQLLKDSDLKIARIASMCGYDSLHGFYTVFEKTAGCTPSEYRLRCESEKQPSE